MKTDIYELMEYIKKHNNKPEIIYKDSDKPEVLRDYDTQEIRAIAFNKDGRRYLFSNDEGHIVIYNNANINQDIEFTWPDINKKEIIQKGRCLGLKEQIAILVDGTVVPCCLDNNGDISLGNIFKEELEDILNKPKTITIKKNFENSIITCKLCKTCGFLERLENKRRN